MIGRLQGVILQKNPPGVLLDVGGVGYEIDVPMSTFYHLPTVGEKVILSVHMIVREDAQLLFGFGTLIERSLFRALLKVNGVGARVALAILSGMSADEFSLCIQHKDVGALTKIPGIGKKTAERLVVEMGDKLPDEVSTSDDVGLPATSSTVLNGGAASVRSQALSALTSLGYKPTEAAKLVDGSDEEHDTVEEIIRAALKQVTQ